MSNNISNRPSLNNRTSQANNGEAPDVNNRGALPAARNTRVPGAPGQAPRTRPQNAPGNIRPTQNEQRAIPTHPATLFANVNNTESLINAMQKVYEGVFELCLEGFSELSRLYGRPTRQEVDFIPIPTKYRNIIDSIKRDVEAMHFQSMEAVTDYLDESGLLQLETAMRTSLIYTMITAAIYCPQLPDLVQSIDYSDKRFGDSTLGDLNLDLLAIQVANAQ